MTNLRGLYLSRGFLNVSTYLFANQSGIAVSNIPKHLVEHGMPRSGGSTRVGQILHRLLAVVVFSERD